jgi:nucleoside-diphosphate kinase
MDNSMPKPKQKMVNESQSSTFVMIKPDGVQRGFVGQILSRFEKKGFIIRNIKTLVPSKELVGKHYQEHKGKNFFNGVINYVTMGSVIAIHFIAPYPNCFEIARKMIGNTFVDHALPGTIRGDFGISRPHNIIHGSDSTKSANREIELWFGN